MPGQCFQLFKEHRNNLRLFSFVTLLKILACLLILLCCSPFFSFSRSNKDYSFAYWIWFFCENSFCDANFYYYYFVFSLQRASALGRLCHGRPETWPNRITINSPVNLWRSKHKYWTTLYAVRIYAYIEKLTQCDYTLSIYGSDWR